jgi:hypothetical protein
MQINLSCLDGLVPKPESNNRTVDAILEKVHGGGMSQRVRTYILPPKGRALFCGDGDVFLHQALNCITAELSASNAGKERIVRTAMALPYPGFQYFCRFGTERCASMFSALSLAVDVGTRSQNNVLASQACQLGDPKASLYGEQQQGSVAAAYPSGKVGCPQKGVDLFPIQKFDGPPFVAFGRHREDSLTMQRMGGFLESHVLKERMNRRQADIAGASAVLSTVLEMIEKITNEGHVQVLDREIRGRFTEPVFCKMEKQSEGIAIPRDCIGTCSLLPKQSICKECLKQRGKAGSHYRRASFPLSTRRSVAN